MATFTVPKSFIRYEGKATTYPRPTYRTDCDVVIEIDINAIAAGWGWKALTNKSGKSKILGGAIKVTCKNARRLT